MTLAARCPWCETVFRLTEGQVAAKAGMARCGVCNHTFNVLDALLSDSAVAALERGAQAREASQEAALRASAQSARSLSDAAEPATPPAGASDRPAAPAPLLSVPSFLWRKPAPPAPVAAAPAPFAKIPAAPLAEKPVLPASVPSARPPTDTTMPVAAPAAATAAPKAELLNPAAQPAPVNPPPSVLSKATAAEPIAPGTMAPAPMALWKSEVAPATSREASVPTALPVINLPGPDSVTEAPRATPLLPASPPPLSAPVALTPVSPSEASSASEYEIELPNYDANRAAAEAPAESFAPESLRVKDQLAAIRAVRSAVLGAAYAGPPVAKSDVKIEPVAPSEPIQNAPRDEGDVPPLALKGREQSAAGSVVVEPASTAVALSTDDANDAERLGPPTFQPSFLRVDEPTGPGRRFLRAIGGLLCLVLVLALAAQSAYWWRSELALRVPQLRPYLAQACVRLRCDIEPPAEIDQLSIESSELVAVPGSANTLGFTALVRNHSSNALTYPAIEITLTDAHDQAILRRVFFPQSYLADTSKEHLLAGIPGNSEFSFKLAFNTSGVATTGYRAGIFYP